MAERTATKPSDGRTARPARSSPPVAAGGTARAGKAAGAGRAAVASPATKATARATLRVTADGAQGDGAPVRHRRWRKLAAGLTIFGVLVVGVLFVGYLPARTWLRQHREIDSARSDLAVLTDQNRRLEGEIARLRDPAEVARIARAEYSMVKQNEAAYAIIPGATTSTTLDPSVTAEVLPDGAVVPVTTGTTRP
jgi:cell division protein FtsB